VATAAFDAGLPLAEALLPLARENAAWGGLVGRLYVQRGRAELLQGRDPVAWLDRAQPLLLAAARIQPSAHAALGEAELTRAAWSARTGGDPGPALRRARVQGQRLAAADSRAAEGPLLEARALSEGPPPPRRQLEQALTVASRAVALDGRRPLSRLVEARLRLALATGTARALPWSGPRDYSRAWPGSPRCRLPCGAPPLVPERPSATWKQRGRAPFRGGAPTSFAGLGWAGGAKPPATSADPGRESSHRR